MTPFHVRAAQSDAEIAQAYELAARVFGPNYHDARATKDRVLLLEPPGDPRDVVVAVAGDAVVGLVRIVDREADVGSGVAKIGGITSVAVHPDYRGTGCGRLLMEQALDRSRERGDVFSVAFARRAVDGFYWRLGYAGLGAHVRITCVVAAQPPSVAGIVRGLQTDWLQAYASIYDHTYAGQTLRFRRPAGWWTSLRDRCPWLTDDSVVTVVDGDAPVAYYIEDEGVVIEAASAPGRLDALRAAVLAAARSQEGEVRLALSPAHPLAEGLSTFNHTAAVRRAWDGGHIVRALDHERILALVGDRMTASERDAWRSCDLHRHDDARQLLMMAAAGSMVSPPVWSKLDEF